MSELDLKYFEKMRKRKGQILIKDWEIYPGKIIKAGRYIDVHRDKARELIASGHLADPEKPLMPKAAPNITLDSNKGEEVQAKEAEKADIDKELSKDTVASKEIKKKKVITK